jgi:malate dehydrogenase (oxaloacetate-decarboxylating)(NADP+)
VPLAVEIDRAAASVAAAGAEPLSRYRAAMAVAATSAPAFVGMVRSNVGLYLPDVYTPGVGAACAAWSTLVPRPPCLYITAGADPASCVASWPATDAALAVLTDGERILGLGDLGAGGAGISVGKCALHAAAGGLAPSRLVPVLLDAGTDNERLLADPLYVGLRQKRLRGAAFDSFVASAVAALRARWPLAVLHFEDFAAADADRWLVRAAADGPAFDDDSQATGAVTLAAILGATRTPGVPQFADQTFLFFGAGQAGTGAAAAVVAELGAGGVPLADALRRVFLVDSKGLVTADRGDRALAPWKAAYARPAGEGLPTTRDLATLVAALSPTALIGSAAVGGAFDEGVLRALAKANAGRRPIVLALSNPTAFAECTAADAAAFTAGAAVYGSGTKFPGAASQVNNCLIFPGVGLGLAAANAVRAPAGPLLPAARALAGCVTRADAAAGMVLPPLDRLVTATRAVAAATALAAVRAGDAGPRCVAGLLDAVRARDPQAAAEKALAGAQYDPEREE